MPGACVTTVPAMLARMAVATCCAETPSSAIRLRSRTARTSGSPAVALLRVSTTPGVRRMAASIWLAACTAPNFLSEVAYRVVLSSRMLGRMYHAEGVERKIRNSVLGMKSPRDFYDGLQWLYGGTGLAA